MELNKYIEHTLLKQDARNEDLEKLYQEAIDNKFFGVCVNPVNVAGAKEFLGGSDVKVVTVVGFPLGASKTDIKIAETVAALMDGADEIDMVMNVSDMKNKDYEAIKREVQSLKLVCQEHVLKVIIETDLLTVDEIKKACELCAQAGADIVKTSTGFVKNGVGAKVEDVKLMFEMVQSANIGVKASGGVRDRETALAMIEAGATRIGTSSGVKICS